MHVSLLWHDDAIDEDMYYVLFSIALIFHFSTALFYNMSDSKRQRIDCIDYLLNLDEDDFHAKFLRRLASNKRSEPKLQETLYRKLEALQNLIYSDAPHPKSPQVYEELILDIPDFVELKVRNSNNEHESLRTIRKAEFESQYDVEDIEYDDFYSDMFSFLGSGLKNSFKNVTVVKHNPLVQAVLNQLMDTDNLTNLKISDSGGLRTTLRHTNFSAKTLTIDCDLETERHGFAIHHALTSDDSQLEVLRLENLQIDDPPTSVTKLVKSNTCVQSHQMNTT